MAEIYETEAIMPSEILPPERKRVGYFGVLRSELTTVTSRWKAASEAGLTGAAYFTTAWLWLTGAANWQVMVVGGFSCFLTVAFIYQAGESAWRKERNKRLEAERVIAAIMQAKTLPDLHIRFDPNDEAMWWREERWCRITVMNDSPTAMARNVKVRLMKMTPYLLPFKALPSRLGVKGEDNTKECSIVPKGTQLFDVFRWASPQTNDFVIWILESSGSVFKIPVGTSCDLSIEVEADLIQPKSYLFRISRTTDGESTFLDVTP